MFRRIANWFEDRTGIAASLGPLIKHPVPADTDWWYALGSSTLVAFVILVATGIALATGYTPDPSSAYRSIDWLTNSASFGHQLRAVHYFAASAMVILVGMHALHVFVSGSFKYPREVNWLVGVALLFLTLLMAFTGQLLRWDQNAVWTVYVGAEQAGRTPFVDGWLAQLIMGGTNVGGATLTRFYASHVFFVPALIFSMVGFHLFLVIRNGVSERPKSGRPVDPKTYKKWYPDLLRREGVPFWPDAAWKDVLVAVGVVAAIAALALIIGPPELGKPPDPTNLNAAPEPDWYFLRYFAALAVIPYNTQNLIIIGGPLLLVVLMITLPFFAGKGERSPKRRPWAVGMAGAILLLIGSLLYASKHPSWAPNFEAKPLPASLVGASSGPVWQGAQLFNQQSCEYCHLIGSYGGVYGPNLTHIASRYTTGNMIIRILGGAYNMPAYTSILKPAQVSDLVAFLSTRR